MNRSWLVEPQRTMKIFSRWRYVWGTDKWTKAASFCKKQVTACVLWASGRRRETREFGTFTGDLLRLVDWLHACGVTHAAMESTGVYWKPVWNLLEGEFEVLLVNAQHIK